MTDLTSDLMLDYETNRDEALIKLTGMLEIMDLMQTILALSEGQVTAEELLSYVQDRAEELNTTFDPPLVCMVTLSKEELEDEESN